ncbi:MULTISPECIES: ribosomal L7Ae/L30e/S12e/Gadd45 family protein [Paenisporosarcina]|uniref:50S ribosomal protein L7ae-like protein n=1 Tax=Paenisporosarcina antarctica TaxID=417367 RepID=A0A4V1AMM3_9BACL|nr:MULTISPECIES: ribosomal L7Ae/L30e/S12e/Gadd45 family protein [Paenisporosarcina]QBP39775.1 50S ribosomal protein L7ae-like protein [Paenisporosarcina antarctica]
MSYEKVNQAKKTVIGTKQTVKAIHGGHVLEILVARDADNRITQPALLAAKENGVKIDYVESKIELGKACGLQVGASVVAITM